MPPRPPSPTEGPHSRAALTSAPQRRHSVPPKATHHNPATQPATVTKRSTQSMSPALTTRPTTASSDFRFPGSTCLCFVMDCS
ncbi:hypothetical protein NOCARDAX2BIS_710005 [Nocardioides sp. AX2bis]|nr:hypothetical protein NOCARDAX2BIS_710005 [Nocardioides sp. AX2bis]